LTDSAVCDSEDNVRELTSEPLRSPDGSRREFDISRPGVLGILNVTPDSFSDGDRWATLDAQVARAIEIASEGAVALDVGGESTRPRGLYGEGASPVGLDEERRRVLPLLEALERRGYPIPISVDTRKAALAREAFARGASMVNDVSALGDEEMASVVDGAGATIILMHMKGTPETMQLDPCYEDVVGEVEAFLRARRACVKKALVDPGIGFGKTAAHNWELLRATSRLTRIAPVCVGVSRKGFLSKLLGERSVAERLGGGIGAALAAVATGASLVRTHDVRVTVDALRAFCEASGP
jgi:dihydropteroate synthase